MENLNTEVKNAFIEFHSTHNQHIVQAIEKELKLIAKIGRRMVFINKEGFIASKGVGDFEDFCKYAIFYFRNSGLKVERYSTWLEFCIDLD
jgi:hypothetical protein